MNRLDGASLLRTRLQILLWRHGWAWLLALVLAGVAGSLQWMFLQPLRATLAASQAELSHARSSASTKPAPSEPLSEERELDALQAGLRVAQGPAELVRRMTALAAAEQIALQQADYQQQLHPMTQLVQVHITQPVRASYPQLRRYVESVLRTIPNAALDQVMAHRENVGQAHLQVKLRWSIWLPRDAQTLPIDTEKNVK